MNLDEVKQVQDQLQNRVDESRNWAASGFAGWATLEIRKRGCDYSVKPVQLLENPEIKQGDGVRFQIQWDKAGHVHDAYLEIRLSPNWKVSETRKGNGNWQGPLVKCRATSRPDEPGKVNSRDDILAPCITIAGVHSGESIQEFYKQWIRKAIGHERFAKVTNLAEIA
jgi:hypothetical protein